VKLGTGFRAAVEPRAVTPAAATSTAVAQRAITARAVLRFEARLVITCISVPLLSQDRECLHVPGDHAVDAPGICLNAA
jgi:hypothetical protein